MNIKYLTSAGLAVVVAGIAVIVFAVGGGTARTRPSHNVPAASAVSVRSTSLGKTLVDAQGRTLYLFEGDGRNVSRLSSAGLSVWPRFVAAGPVTAGNGVQMAKLGSDHQPERRPAGHLQRPSSLLLRRGHQAGQHPRPGAEPVRRAVVRPAPHR